MPDRPNLIRAGDLVVIEALIAAGGRRVRVTEGPDGSLEVVQEDGMGPFLPVGVDVHVIPADSRWDEEAYEMTLPPVAATWKDRTTDE